MSNFWECSRQLDLMKLLSVHSYKFGPIEFFGSGISRIGSWGPTSNNFAYSAPANNIWFDSLPLNYWTIITYRCEQCRLACVRETYEPDISNHLETQFKLLLLTLFPNPWMMDVFFLFKELFTYLPNFK